MNTIIGEAGVVTNFTHESQTIFFDHNYNNPVIFAQPLSYNGSNAAIVRIENIQSDRFTAHIQETSNLDGKHTNESFSYLVVEEGIWQLDNDTLLEVGKVNTNLLTSNGWETVDINDNFADNPLIFSQVQTKNGGDFVRTRQKNSSSNGFQIAMEEEEALNKSGHATETIGWMAISGGSGSWGQSNYLAGTTGNTVNHNWHQINFDNNFSQPPAFLASIASYNGGDSSGLRSNNLNSNQVQLKVEEDYSQDQETSHVREKINFLAIDGNNPLQASKVEKNGTLLFKSGFEGDINIVPYGTNRHTISGTDEETNYSWDSDLPAERAQFLYLTGDESPEPYIDNRIEEVIGPDGKLTSALYMEVTKDYPNDNYITRNEFQLFPPGELNQAYISYSMKLQDNYLDAWPHKDAWRVFMEWKEPNVDKQTGDLNYNYRLQTAIHADREQIHWTAQTQQGQPEQITEWREDNKRVSVPIDEWFDVEVFWRQGDKGDGRLWLAINGVEVFDHHGLTQHRERPQDLKFWSIFKLYSGLDSLQQGPLYQWIDNVEIHSDFPNS